MVHLDNRRRQEEKEELARNQEGETEGGAGRAGTSGASTQSSWCVSRGSNRVQVEAGSGTPAVRNGPQSLRHTGADGHVFHPACRAIASLCVQFALDGCET
jgi:hypothetical protein